MNDATSHICKPALISSARYFGGELLGRMRLGWNGRSLSSEILLSASGERAWLRVKYFSIGKQHSIQATGEKAAEAFDRVIAKPILLGRIEWQEGPQIWRADLLTLAESSVCSPTPHLTKNLALSPQWFSQLKQTLLRISSVPTERVAVRQDLLVRRIQEQFGRTLTPTVTRWSTAHADLNWANLTAPKLAILDWESWGKAPFGFDAALLYCFSGLIPVVASQVRATFEDVFQTPDGTIAMLFACAELKRSIDLHGDHPELEPWLNTVAFEFRTKLSVLG